MGMPASDFVRACSFAELKAKGRLVLHGRHSPVLVIYDGDASSRSTTAARTWAFRWTAAVVEDGILTCHWHHARFDLARPQLLL